MSIGLLKEDAKRIWIRVGDDDRRRVDELLKAFPYMKEAPLVSTLLSAALRACERNGFTNLPMEFSVELDAPKEDVRLKLNDPAGKGSRGK
jgi:hypothetical protein